MYFLFKFKKIYLIMSEYLKPFIESIDKTHQITHLCVPDIGTECMTQVLINELKDEYGITITIVPFNSDLFPPTCKNGVYLLIDCLNDWNIMVNIGRIQRCFGRELTKYKKINPPSLPKCRKDETINCETALMGQVIWTLSYISDRRHKWDVVYVL